MSSLTPGEAIKILTGRDPVPIVLSAELAAQAKREGEMRIKHRIIDEEKWIEQLERRHGVNQDCA